MNDTHQIAAEAEQQIEAIVSMRWGEPHHGDIHEAVRQVIQSAIKKATKELRASLKDLTYRYDSIREKLWKLEDGSRAAHPTRDQWHTASEQPKPEDFDPTGQVLCLTFFESGKIHPWFGTPKNQLADADYWHPIEPPSKSCDRTQPPR